MYFQPEDNYDTRIAKREKVKKKSSRFKQELKNEFSLIFYGYQRRLEC